MKLEVNKIARLNNDEKYIILNELDYDGNKYYLTMGLISDNEYDSSKVIILKETKDGNGYYVEKVIDKDLLYELTKQFKEQL
ncbi:MAG: DUF1292 domain-containing protein [Bacilli bacterium]|nr:DUF1292 domain-containing protein [Bacilli bacterium]